MVKTISQLEICTFYDYNLLHCLVLTSFWSCSVAIFRYLCGKYSIPDNLYPKDLVKRAKVDEYLEWQHMNTRYFYIPVFKYLNALFFLNCEFCQM